MIKLNEKYLEEINKRINKTYFGDWINNIEKLKTIFVQSKPFGNIVIDNFLNEEYANEIEKVYPKINEEWYKYNNPLEVKYAYDKINSLSTPLKDYFYILSSNEISSIFSELTEIDNLEKDEYLHGAGLHAHPRGGRLNVHLDYEKHPYTINERRLNIILFLNKEWNEKWNGENELWNENECIKTTQIKFNRAIIFKTNNISWHGISKIISCPEDIYRKTLAYYYIKPFKNEENKNKSIRTKAQYTPNHYKGKYINKDILTKLCEIRKTRLIEEADMIDISDWNSINDI